MTLPAPLRWLKEGWMAFSHVLGRIMSWIILTIVWIVLFGLYGIIMKVVLLFRSRRTSNTYWVDPLPEVPDALTHQF